MEKCVTLVTSGELSDKVLAIVNGIEAQALLGSCPPFHFVVAIATQDKKTSPNLVSEAATCCAGSAHYLVYIGSDITERIEGSYGVLLPVGILYDKRALREDIIDRIRKFVGGSTDDN